MSKQLFPLPLFWSSVITVASIQATGNTLLLSSLLPVLLRELNNLVFLKMTKKIYLGAVLYPVFPSIKDLIQEEYFRPGI